MRVGHNTFSLSPKIISPPLCMEHTYAYHKKKLPTFESRRIHPCFPTYVTTLLRIRVVLPHKERPGKEFFKVEYVSSTIWAKWFYCMSATVNFLFKIVQLHFQQCILKYSFMILVYNTISRLLSRDLQFQKILFWINHLHYVIYIFFSKF